MAVITVEKLKMIIQSMLASVTRYKPNLEVEDPEDPRYVAGKLPVKKLPQIPGSKIKSVPVQKVEGLSPVATSGSYNDLSNKPTIPTVPGDTVRYNISQSLTDTQKKTARTNIGAGDGTYANLTGAPTLAKVATSGSYTDLFMKPTIPTNVVKYESQSLNSSEKLQARQNIGADDYNNLDNKPCYKIPVLTEIDSFTGSLVSGKYYKGKNNPGYALEAGKEYAVKFNGVTYYQTAREKKGGVYTYVVLGNPSQATGDVTGGDELEGATGPFCIDYTVRSDAPVIEMHSLNSGTAILYDVSYDVKLVPQELLGADPAPYKQLVTDADGKTVWEDRLAWKESKEYALLTLDNTQEVGSQSVPDGWTRTQTNMALWEYSTTLETVGLAWVLDDLSALVGNVVKVYQGGSVSDYTVAESDVTDEQINCQISGGCFLKIKTDGTLTIGVEGSAATYLVSAYPMAIVAETIKPIDPPLIGGWKALGEGEPVRTVIADNVSVTTQDNISEEAFTFEVQKDATYYVTYDGTDYICKPKDSELGLYIGSESLWNDEGAVDGEEPFAYGDGYLAVSVDGTHTISIISEKIEIIPIPEDYLPEKIKGAFVASFTLAGDDTLTADFDYNDLANARDKGMHIKATLTSGGYTREIAYKGVSTDDYFVFEYYLQKYVSNDSTNFFRVTIRYNMYDIRRYKDEMVNY